MDIVTYVLQRRCYLREWWGGAGRKYQHTNYEWKLQIKYNKIFLYENV